MSTLYDAHGQPLQPFRLNLVNNHRKSIDQLIGLSRGILADGVVNAAEAETFRKFAASIPSEMGWPLDDIRDRVAAIHAAGFAEDEERNELAEIMRQLAGVPEIEESTGDESMALPLDDPAPNIIFAAHEFCVTGKFAYGVRSKVVQAIEERLGTTNPAPRESTHFLVVGAFASRDWAHSTYGRKIEHAVELRLKNTGIKIVGEKHWSSFLKGKDVSANGVVVPFSP